ncbi:hypothetical protein [Streptomyces sp. NBC_00690]|uniref:hypothetical protein n=1 Tax=Streptomyces sp. NBC_00690 TaxID=2975808 RepID=UPI002E2D7834|nr:hypothetical protein [Streptomyces sp. NBC_00690]
MTEQQRAPASGTPTPTVIPSDTTRRTALWRRRLFEAEAGLTRFLVEARAGVHMQELLLVKQAIFESLPDGEEENDWKAAFFRGQALMEKFVVAHFGLDDLAAWAESNSTIYAAVDPGPKHDAAVPLERLNAQADLYDSDTEWVEHGADRSVLRIRHCAIWDYRELARDRGVTITLRSPCEYCVPATTGMITNKGLSATHELTEDQNGKGCVWTTSRNVSRPADGHRAVSEG